MSSAEALSPSESEPGGGREELRSRLVAALLHPLRAQVLGIVAERPASAKDIAIDLKISAESAGHQLRRLRREGLVQIVERKSRRGVAEIFYRATLEPILDDEEYAALSVQERSRISATIIRRLHNDARRALEAHTFDARTDSCHTHMRMLVDERGWRELAEIHREAFEKALAVRGEAATRLARATDAGIPVASSIICFELPELA